MPVTNSAAQAAPGEGAKQPAHETVYQKLRAQILFGELAPGQAVTIQGLTESLGAGMTPVREAIRQTKPGGKPQAHGKYWQELLGQVGGGAGAPAAVDRRGNGAHTRGLRGLRAETLIR